MNIVRVTVKKGQVENEIREETVQDGVNDRKNIMKWPVSDFRGENNCWKTMMSSMYHEVVEKRLDYTDKQAENFESMGTEFIFNPLTYFKPA